jgi:methylthioribose-1-phosphate isomerase
VWTAGCNQCPQIALRRPPGVTRVSTAGSRFRFSYSFAATSGLLSRARTYLDLEYESTNEQGLATNNQMIHTLEWTDAGVRFIDQTKLPTEEVYVTCKTHEQVADVIRNMVVRGAPAIGVAAAMGLALAVKNSKADTVGALKKDFDEACELIGKTRPTAVNLFWAIRRMQEKLERARIQPIGQIKRTVIEEAKRIHAEDIAANQAMGRHGATLMPSSGGVLTHCNAGALATAGYGTALGVIRAAVEQGKKIHVYADETRPFLQGSRLTAWELMKDGIPTTVISDNMAGAMMKQGKIGAIVVGADRIAANGDVANKIGTYTVAVLAKENGIPFYVAAPFSTIDLDTPDGSKIPIEQRNPREISHIAGKQMVPDGVEIENPAFDVTPAKYVGAIITERGIAKAPYTESLSRLADAASVAAET